MKFSRRFFYVWTIFIALCVVLAGCGGGGGSSASSSTTATSGATLTASAQSISVEGYVYVPGQYVNTKTLAIPVSNPSGVNLLYSVYRQPTYGTATIANGVMTYSLVVPSTATADTLQINVTGGGTSVLVDVAVQVLADPYTLVGAATQSLGVAATGSATMTSQTLQVNVTDPQNLPLSYSLTSQPAKGIASISNTGVLTYSIGTLTNATSDSISVFVTNGTRVKNISVPVTITTDPNAIQASNQSLNVEAFGSGTTTRTLQILAKDPNPLAPALSYSITVNPTKGTASINSSGLLTYNITAPTVASSDSLQVTISNGTKSRVISVLIGVDNTINVDPLLNWQWHLVNQNQYFSSTNPAMNAGCDLNIFPSASRSCGGVAGVAGTSLWANGIKGNNVNVTVVDTGMEIAHEDLAANVVAGGSYNFKTATTNPTNTATTGDHGTSVAGLIAGVANNGVGISGIAPKAKLRGYNYLSSTQSLSQFATTFGGDSSQGSFQSDVFNFSAGSESATLYSPSTAGTAVYVNAANNLRSGKGAIVVKSAGNAFEGMTDSLGNRMGATTAYCYTRVVPLETTDRVSCQNANNDDDNTVYSNIVVASANADGTKSTYSTAGSPIWITGFGGQNGYDIAIAGSGYFTHRYRPAMLTTDQSGCALGYVSVSALTQNALNRGNGTGISNANCSYTSTFNGTSSAAPTVAGVAALMLQANPNLTWRDVRHILASTARKISAFQAAVTNTTYFSGSTLILEQGWVTNAAGFNFHNYFGFGLVDATAAVNAAKAYVAGSLGTFTSKTVSATLAPTAVNQTQGVNGLTKTFTVSGMSKVEQVELMFYPATGYTPWCTQIEVISPNNAPNNTKSILLNMDSGHTGVSSLSTTSGTRMLSNAFYGENANGVWTVRFINRCTTAQNLSSIYPQQLTFRGR